MLDLPQWAGHQAGQHVDVRLTAADGYQAERSYSIASAPGEPLALTVEDLPDGEVSPYLVEDVRPGDQFEVRGPIGGYFIWDGGASPVLLIGGGSGIVPLRSILRHRARTGSQAPARLLYSARTAADLVYKDELDSYHDGAEVIYTLTREQPPGWSGYARRVDAAMLAEVAWPPAQEPVAYVCGPTNFVEAVAAGLVDSGYPARSVRTERFGGTGES